MLTPLHANWRFVPTPSSTRLCSNIPDALEDSRFSVNPLVLGELRIRFYAGAPLITPGGHRLGTICVIDRERRTLTAEQLDVLKALSRVVVEHLECRRLVVGLADGLRRSRILSGLLLTCSYFKRIRDDRNYWREVESVGFDDVTFAWAGPAGVGEPHYYAIRQPRFLIEKYSKKIPFYE